MAVENQNNDETLIEVTAEVVAAYVSNNALSAGDLPNLLSAVYTALSGLRQPVQQVAQEEPQKPAVPVRKSVTPDYIVCLDDGQKFKSLKRHLAQLGMTPQQYRSKWQLPSDYPMVAPNYSATRSALAKSRGLGKKVPPVKAAPAAVKSRGRAAAVLAK
ncbi:MAG: MucR family transcriptional regulator [Devosia sp.]|nr:MucR family transcriptional regulator [Devosia sp.]